MSSAVSVDVHLDPAHWARDLALETRRGLAGRPPSTPPVWFYDDHGSALFDRITRLPEYYLTRAERSILLSSSATIASVTQADTLIELGSGTSEKTRILLDAFTPTLRRFVPFDCSEATLRESAVAIARERPGLEVGAVVGDFHRHLDRLPGDGRRVIAFLGSTIGNFDPMERRRFLGDIATGLGSHDWLLLGTDLVKDVARLHAAYDDSAGVTAEFNRNALRVMNRELGADFDVDAFRHEAVWDAREARIEMRLVATSQQQVRFAGLDDLCVDFAGGEWLRTEISSKFTRDQVALELSGAGLGVAASWTDARDDFLLTLAKRV